MECSSARKKHESALFAATWMKVEVITLSEISQARNRKKNITHSHRLVGVKNNDDNKKKVDLGWAPWLTPVILAL